MSEENPKAAMGRQKIDFSAVPSIAQLYIAAAADYGAIKYGWHNWREKKIRLTDYIAPIERHMNAAKSGQDIDASGLPHRAHIAAGCSIVIDAMHYGSYEDDRAKTSDYEEVLAHITKLKQGWVEDRQPGKLPKSSL